MTESSFGRLAGALVAPGKTFESIARRPTWAVALVFLVSISVLVAFQLAGKMDFEEIVRESLEQRGQNLSEEQIADAVETQERIGPIATVVGAGVFAPVFYLVTALLFWVLFKLGGSEMGYKQSLGATLHGFMPAAVGGLLHLPVIASRDSIGFADVGGGNSNLLASNLAILAPDDAGPALLSLLGSVDLFSIWIVVLLGIGYSAVGKVSQKAAWITVATVWLVVVFAKAGWIALVS